MNRTPDKVITPEAWSAAVERMAADAKRDPQLAAMRKAAEPTKAEREAIAAAQADVERAKAAFDAAGVALANAKRGKPAPVRGFRFFERSPQAHRADRADLVLHEQNVREAQMTYQNATRRLNATIRRIDLDRAMRRKAAKLAHAPKVAEPKRRATWAELQRTEVPG